MLSTLERTRPITRYGDRPIVRVVQAKRDKDAALRLMRKLLRNQGGRTHFDCN